MKPNTTLLNALPIAVKYRDGRSETIILRELPIRELYRWIELFTERNTPALVALCASRDPDWIDTLSDESFGDLTAEAFRLNFPRATALSLKDVTVAARLMPALDLMASLGNGVPSPDRSPAHVASALLGENGSGSLT